MESSKQFYDNTDIESGQLFHEMDKAVRKKMKEKEQPKTKPQEVFEGFKETKTTKKVKKRGPNLRYRKEQKVDYRK
tara:strand:+ start:417 stop:644 length:228 start_codon:yes stop_codon:yes gene_type:complete